MFKIQYSKFKIITHVHCTTACVETLERFKPSVFNRFYSFVFQLEFTVLIIFAFQLEFTVLIIFAFQLEFTVLIIFHFSKTIQFHFATVAMFNGSSVTP